MEVGADTYRPRLADLSVRLVPLSDAVAPSRTSHRRLIGELRAWALARGVAVDPDLLALHLAWSRTTCSGTARPSRTGRDHW